LRPSRRASPRRRYGPSMAKRSSYQDRIIRRYYENQDDIMLQRLGELVSELYLAEGKARTRLWDRAGKAMKNLNVPAERVEHIVASDNPLLVANLLKEYEGRTTKG
jgi:hypothetical protein